MVIIFCVQCDGCVDYFLSPVSAAYWMSGTDLLQTLRAWFGGTHKWAVSAALLDSRVGRTAGNVQFDLLLHFGTDLRF